MAVTIWRRLLVDRVGMTVLIPDQDLYGFALGQLYGIADEQKTLLPGGKIRVVKEDYQTRLEYYPDYHSKKNNRRIAEIALGANILFGAGKLHRYFSLTLYPTQFCGNEFAAFQEMLELLLPEFNYPKLYETARVNYLELAADSLSHIHHSFLPYRTYCKASKIWKGPDGHLGTTYLGSETSDLRFRIYDKKKQLLDKKKTPFTTDMPHTRFEAAIRRLGVAPVELVHMVNPFVKLRIADMKKAEAASGGADWQAFLAESLVEGIPGALSSRPKSRKEYMAMLNAVRVPWWTPERFWEDLPRALTAIAP